AAHKAAATAHYCKNKNALSDFFRQGVLREEVFPNYSGCKIGLLVVFSQLTFGSVDCSKMESVVCPGRNTVGLAGTAKSLHVDTVPLPSTKIITAFLPPQTPPLMVLSVVYCQGGVAPATIPSSS